jgi:hypothetical protein
LDGAVYALVAADLIMVGVAEFKRKRQRRNTFERDATADLGGVELGVSNFSFDVDWLDAVPRCDAVVAVSTGCDG